jgi:hypothetical protein
MALLGGERTPTEVGPAAIRLVPILLSMVTAWLLYLLAARHLGRATALVALAVFCLSPWMIDASRLVEAEWLLAPMLLGVLVLASHRGRLPTATLLALCVLAPLVKVPGVIVGAAGAVALLTERRWLTAGLALLGAPVGIGLFAAYGAAVDWHQFVLVWQVQSSRHTSLVAGRQFLFSSDAGLWNFVPLDDPLWTVGMVGLAVMLLRQPLGRAARIPLAFAGYALLMTLTASTEGAQYYDWYRFVVDPLCCIGVGDLIGRNLPRLRIRPSTGSGPRSTPCAGRAGPRRRPPPEAPRRLPPAALDSAWWTSTSSRSTRCGAPSNGSVSRRPTRRSSTSTRRSCASSAPSTALLSGPSPPATSTGG